MEKVTCEQRTEESARWVPGISMFQPQGRANAKALRRKHARNIRARTKAITADEQGQEKQEKKDQKDNKGLTQGRPTDKCAMSWGTARVYRRGTRLSCVLKERSGHCAEKEHRGKSPEAEDPSGAGDL